MTKPNPRPLAPMMAPYLPYFSAPALENDWPPGWLPATDNETTDEQDRARLAERQASYIK